MTLQIEHRLRELLATVQADVGLAVRGVDVPLQIDINSHEQFRSASVIKVPLLATLFWLQCRAELDWNAILVMQEADRTPGSGVLRELHSGLSMTVRDLAVLMIVISDNTATNMLIDHIGVESVQRFLQRMGLYHTTLQRKMYDFVAAEQGRENLCSAADIADLLQGMALGELRATDGEVLVDKAGCEQMLQIMQNQIYRDLIPALLPDDAKVASKTGEIGGHYHDCAVVWTPANCYSIAILTRGFTDRRTASEFVAELSYRVYEDVRLGQKRGN